MNCNRILKHIFPIILFSACITPLAHADTIVNPAAPLKSGMKAPDFSGATIDGKPISLKALHGKVVLLDYWASWCGPCRASMPMLEKLQHKFGKQGFVVVGMSMDDSSTMARVKPMLVHDGITYTIMATPDANAKATRAYHVTYPPCAFIIDKRGIIRWSQIGIDKADEKFVVKLIKKLLAS